MIWFLVKLTNLDSIPKIFFFFFFEVIIKKKMESKKKNDLEAFEQIETNIEGLIVYVEC